MIQLTGLQKRWITSLAIAIPLVVLVVTAPEWVIMLVVVLAVIMSVIEACNLVLPSEPTLKDTVILCGAALCFPIGGFLAGELGLHIALIAVTLCHFVAYLYLYSKGIFRLSEIFSLLGGSIYVGYFLGFVTLFRLPNGEPHRGLLLFVLITVAATDAGAFFIGRRFGKRPLCPSVSPKKTVEGMFGGFGAAVLFGTFSGWLLVDGFTILKALCGAFSISFAAQVGDLFESALKRRKGVKDSGTILPGHGGVLDRLDSLLFAFPMTWIFWRLLEIL